MAVVKSNAYSHGAKPIARHIQDQVDYFATANVDEAIELRMSGITRPILVFGVPDYQTAAAYQTHGLTATISHLSHFSVLMDGTSRSEEHTSELQSRGHLVCRLRLEKKKRDMDVRRR